jgi:hypothetical protein
MVLCASRPEIWRHLQCPCLINKTLVNQALPVIILDQVSLVIGGRKLALLKAEFDC